MNVVQSFESTFDLSCSLGTSFKPEENIAFEGSSHKMYALCSWVKCINRVQMAIKYTR